MEWTEAERRALTDICTHEGLHKACDRCNDYIFDATEALAPFVAERERRLQAENDRLREILCRAKDMLTDEDLWHLERFEVEQFRANADA